MLKVDGGMTASDLLLQIQADLVDAPVIRPNVTETTCLGAAYAAGLAVGFWPDLAALREQLAGGPPVRPGDVRAERREAERAPVAQGGRPSPWTGPDLTTARAAAAPRASRRRARRSTRRRSRARVSARVGPPRSRVTVVVMVVPFR